MTLTAEHPNTVARTPPRAPGAVFDTAPVDPPGCVAVGAAPDPPAPAFDRSTLAARLASCSHGERAALILQAAQRAGPPDLAGADLRNLDFAAACSGNQAVPRLDGVDLTGAMLSGSVLRGMSLRGARLSGAMLVGTDLSSVDLSGASLRGANLSGADLARADLSFCDLRDASLLTADLTCAILTGADMREALLHSAQLPRATLRGADMRWARLNGARMVNCDLRGVRLNGATLALADLTGARVSDSTDLSDAFLFWARLDRVPLRRRHLAPAIGEAHSDHALARDTYLALMRLFEAEGRPQDARWAYRQACRMNTATHRPDRARRYYPAEAVPRARIRSARKPHVSHRRERSIASKAIGTAGCYVFHTARWLAGHVNRLTTGHGTSFGRILCALAVIWIAFAAAYGATGGVMALDGSGSSLNALRFSAAALTPIDAYPLVPASPDAHLFAFVEGVLGMALLGALGYVAASRLKSS